MAEPELYNKLIALARLLESSTVPYAFGGAIALAAYTEPRGTRDLDIGIFLPSTQARRIVSMLGGLGTEVDTDVDIGAIEAGDWGRILWGSTPIDVFFAYSPMHYESAARTRTLPVLGNEVTVLGPEDVLAHKIVFNREHDWVDISNVLRDQTDLDLDVVRRWIVSLYDADNARRRLLRLNHLAAEHGHSPVLLPAPPPRRGIVARLRSSSRGKPDGGARPPS